MADIRINSLPTTATSFNTDDYIALDGASGGTRKMLAATLPLTDVTFGSSGPSAKSSIAARAARQGLVFDGTATSTSVSAPAFGTSDFTIAAWITPASTGADQVIMGAASGGPGWYVKSSGKLELDKLGSFSGTQSSSAVSFSKSNLVVYTRSGTTGTHYIDAVASGTVTDSQNYTNGVSLIGTDGGVKFTGAITPLIYNRALSAAEVVALYEAGVPAGSDYGASGVPASNTSLITGANSDFSSDTGYWTKANGATISGGKANLTGGANSNILRSGLIAVGKRYRMTVTVGTADGSAYISDGSTTTLVTGGVAGFGSTGTKTFEFSVPTGAATGIQIVSPAGTLVLDDLLFYPIGLLLAPDAGQAGGGLTWYDTSGNAANITLPASGVSWNVPTSGNVTSGGNVVLAPATGYKTYTTKTIQSQIATGSTSISNVEANSALITQAAAGTLGLYFGHDTTANRPLIQSVTGGTAFSFLLNPYGGNVLLGTTTDSSNGKLQLTSHTTSAGGIGFGTDVSLYRVDQYGVGLRTDSGTSIFSLYEGTTRTGGIASVAGTVYIDNASASTSLILRTNNGSNALTLDSSQNATFAGSIKTVAPSGGTAKPWELGEAATVSPTSPNRTIRVEIDGTVYYIHAKTTND